MLKFLIFFLTSFNLFANEVEMDAKIKLINKVSGKNYIYILENNNFITHKNLNISIEKCIKNSDLKRNAAYITIKEIKKNRLLFNAWIFSNNISLSQFSHPIYSIKLINCINN